MNSRKLVLVCFGLLAAIVSPAAAQDWPQWLGPHRNGKADGFEAPATWPKELKRQWKVPVGDGVATPALVGKKLYVFGREGNREVIRCLDTANGQELWKDDYAADDADGAAARFPVLGPRSSPAVAEGKLVTLGTRGMLSCLDAESGQVLWRKQDYRSWPRFFVSSSPLIAEGLCFVQLGEENNGGIVAYNLGTGEEQWKWTGDGPAYGSPVLVALGETRALVAPTAEKLVVLRLNDGKLLLEQPYTQGRYNAATPLIDGERVILAGPTRGITSQTLVKTEDKVSAEPAWSNPDNSLMYNTPVLRDGFLFGLSSLNTLFCINAKTGETAWNAPTDPNAKPEPQEQPQQGQGRRRRGGSGGGYGSLVDAGAVCFALPPTGDLIVFKPVSESYQELARYKVAEGNTYSHPIIAGKRVFIKDKDSLTLWTLE